MPYTDPESRKAYAKAYYQKNKPTGWNKHLHSETPDHREQRLQALRDYQLRRNFGITAADYERMLADQGGNCAMCMQPPKGKAGRHSKQAALAVDHCHTTGRVRKLLCVTCNLGLGWYELNKSAIGNYLSATDDKESA
jgi:hypothetical protein